MAIIAQVSMPFTASASGAVSGLVGTIAVQVARSDGSLAIDRTTDGIIELVPGSGVYLWTCDAAPTIPGDYTVIWDSGADTFASEDLIVALAPIITSGGSGAPPYPTIGTVRAQAQQAQRVVRGRPFVAAYTFGLDGDDVPDDDIVRVSIVNAEGYLVVSDQAAGFATSGPATASFPMAASTTPQRDLFTCLWEATIGGESVVAVSTIDVCDARLFPLSDYAQYAELDRFTVGQLEAQRMWAEDRLEWECGTAFTGRYGVESFTLDEPDAIPRWAAIPAGPSGARSIMLKTPNLQALRSISQTTLEDGVSSTTARDLRNARLDADNGIVVYPDGLFGDVTIGFEYGAPETDARRVCLILARHRLLNGPLDSRATAMAVEGGGTISLLTPGVGGSVFGIPEVDLFVQRHSHRTLGFVSVGA